MNNIDVAGGRQQVRDEVGSYCQKLFQNFLQEFKVDDTIKYLEPAKELMSPERCTLEVSFDDIESYHQALSTSIVEEYYRVYPYLCQAVENFLKDRAGLKESKQCYVSLVDVPTRHNLRELTTPKVGTLIRISGQVIRTYPVHPELVSGTFVCADCNSIIANVEQQFKYTEPTICSNPQCQNRSRFYIDTDKSIFVDFQKVNIQETQAELPKGCIPRTLEVIIRGEAVEIVQPGDKYDFTGTLIVVPDVSVLSVPGAKAELSSRPKIGEQMDGIRGLKALGVRDLNYKLAFLSCSVNATTLRHGGTELGEEEMTPEIMKQRMSEIEWNRIYEMSRDKNLYKNLVDSLFPSIHGNDEVKRGIALMLFGGVPKTTEEGTSLRGDINCCIVGDPSTAKSQLLKLVAEITPRAIYTSGKASSAAGLTAAVVRDEESGDFVIEAGALMLADNGICCIDEFDKMDPRDVVAIHEAMEQQTISIAKAGVRATLNARTSILAAANPIGSRYDRSKSLKDNLMMSAPIMSRFDLFFVLVDECNEIIDTAIATRIIDLHSGNLHNLSTPYTLDEVMRYIDFARRFKPTINEEAGKLLVDSYTALRQREGTGTGSSTWRVTVRQLESLIRLSEAMAKLECLDEVSVKHVREAKALLNKSIVRVEQPDIDLETEQQEEVTENGHEVTSMEVDDNDIQKKKFTISYEDYKKTMDLLVIYLKEQEQEMDDSDDNEKQGVKKSDLIAWYLDQVAEQIESEEDLVERKNIIEKIIQRLLYVDQILIPLKVLKSLVRKNQTDEEPEEEDPIIVVHPNFQISK